MEDLPRTMLKEPKESISIDIKDIRALSKVSNWMGIVTILWEWLLISGAIYLSVRFNSILVYLVAWLIIGTRMYALYSLLHDGIHYLISPKKQVNDWICRLFLSWPLFTSLNKIRKFHQAHHQYLKTPGDPEAIHLQYKEFQFPAPVSGVVFTFLKDITGFNFIFYKCRKIVRSISSSFSTSANTEGNPAKSTNHFEWGMIVYYTVIVIALFYSGKEIQFILYWLLPYITIYQLLNRLRLSTEHFHLPEDKLFQTRTVILNLPERFIFSPHNLGYHAEHHLYPSVPFYRLPALHKKLMSQISFRNNVVVSKSYFQVIKEYVK
jgi:fatty acid desaturase